MNPSTSGPCWQKPRIIRSLSEEELEKQLSGRDLRVRGGGNFDNGSFDQAVEP